MDPITALLALPQFARWAVQLREGQSVGVGQFSGAVLQAASLLASLAAVAGFIYLLARGR